MSETQPRRPLLNIRQQNVSVVIGGVTVLAFLAVLLLWCWSPSHAQSPGTNSVTITEPDGDVVLTASNGSWTFWASGEALREYAGNHLYVFVQGPGSNHYYYSETVDVQQNGDWQGVFYTGSIQADPRRVGDRLRLTAVVTSAQLPPGRGSDGFFSLEHVPGRLCHSRPTVVTVSEIRSR